jgi:hypothetical protein
MTEEDLRDCFAMFAMVGFMMSNTDWDAEDPYKIADKMIEARKHKEKNDEEDSGIVAVVPKRPRKR